jgi:Na+-translocating ferredoxin:NAD+ oxidoreductase RnfE subunit
MGWYRMAIVELIGLGLTMGFATAVESALGLGLETAALLEPQLVVKTSATNTPQILETATRG